MNLKLIITSRLSYYFCGSVALNILNTTDNPLVVDLDKLNKQEVLGLTKASKTGVIKAIEGEVELYSKAASFSNKVKEVTTLTELKEKVNEVVKTIEEEKVKVETEVETDTVEEIITEDTDVVTETVAKPVRKTRTSTVKK